MHGAEFCSIAHAAAFRQHERQEANAHLPAVIDIHPNAPAAETGGQTEYSIQKPEPARLWPVRVGRLRYQLKRADSGVRHTFSVAFGGRPSFKRWRHIRIRLIFRSRRPLRFWRPPAIHFRVVLRLKDVPNWAPVLRRIASL
jgi:hypothetical protein